MKPKFTLIGTFLLLAVFLAACAGQPTPVVNTGVPSPGTTVVVPTDVQGAITEVVPTIVEGAQTAVPTVVEGAQTEIVPTVVEGVQGAGVEDLNTLVTALGAAGMTVEQAGPVEQPFFTAPGQIVRVNGEDVQVYTYETAEALEGEASQISADASTIGTSMPTWQDNPHFFKAGRLLVLYVGQNQKILDLLEGAFGPQFAGR